MKRSRFTEEQIIGILREPGGGGDDGGYVPQAPDQRGDLLQVEGEVRRAGGIGRTAAEGARGREREAEEAAGQAMLDNAMLKDIASKNGDARRQTNSRGSPAPDLCGEPARACKVLGSGSNVNLLLQSAAG